MAITITTTDNTVLVSDSSALSYKGGIGDFDIIKGQNIVIILYLGREIFRDRIANVIINGITLTESNYDTLTEGLFPYGSGGGTSSEVSVTNIDDSKTETPATDATERWTKGQLLRGQLAQLIAMNQKLDGLDTILGSI